MRSENLSVTSQICLQQSFRYKSILTYLDNQSHKMFTRNITIVFFYRNISVFRVFSLILLLVLFVSKSCIGEHCSAALCGSLLRKQNGIKSDDYSHSYDVITNFKNKYIDQYFVTLTYILKKTKKVIKKSLPQGGREVFCSHFRSGIYTCFRCFVYTRVSFDCTTNS